MINRAVDFAVRGKYPDSKRFDELAALKPVATSRHAFADPFECGPRRGQIVGFRAAKPDARCRANLDIIRANALSERCRRLVKLGARLPGVILPFDVRHVVQRVQLELTVPHSRS